MYQLPDLSVWTGRIDTGTQEPLRWHQHVKPLDLQGNIPSAPAGQTSFALLGFCCDEGVRRNFGRVGAREGPAAIRMALRNLCIHFDAAKTSLFDAGDVICSGEKLEAAQGMLGKKILELLQAGYRPLVMGGGHEIAFGHFQGIHPFVSDQKRSLGIINIDAHFDLRRYDDLGNSGTPFLQIYNAVKSGGGEFRYLVLGVEEANNTRDMFERARELTVEWVTRTEGEDDGRLFSAIDDLASQVQSIYLTIDLDAINQAFAPGVSAPSPFGWSPGVVVGLLKKILSTNKIASVDIAELNPAFDQDSRTARLAAGLIYEIVSRWR